MMKIAVTGSRGFLGKALTKKLMEYGHEVREIDLELGHDITSPESLSKVPDFDVLIHLAARSFVPDSFKQPATFYKTNVIGTLNALELCRKNHAKMIFTSSYVYGRPKYLPIDENHPVNAFNPYAQSKLMGEDLCRAYFRDFDVASIIIRPFNIYGKGQNEDFLIPFIIKHARLGNLILKDPRPKRDYIYIDDVVEAYMRAIYTEIDTVEAFNLGSGVSTSIQELLKIIEEKVNNRFVIKFTGEERKNEVLETRAEISKIKRYLNWEPRISLSDGISEIINV